MEKNILASVISYKGGAFDSIYTKIIIPLVQKRRASIDIRSGGGGSYYILPNIYRRQYPLNCSIENYNPIGLMNNV